jgi:type I restriction enzyme S subunit
MTTNGTEERPLPDGWTWTTIGEVITDFRNGVSGKQNKDGNGYPVSRIETISDGVVNLGKIGYLNVDHQKIEKYQLHEGDILFSNINSDFHLGKTALIGKGYELYHGMNLLLLRPNLQFVLPRFLHYLFNQYRFDGFFISIAQHAVNQSSINQTKLRNVPVPLPPMPEQERIVAEIEKQFTRLDQAVGSLRRLQGHLARYKASVLKAACDGRLVPQVPNDEPAAILLTRILAERRAQWQAANPGKKYKEVAGVETADLPDLPHGWVWARVDQLGEVRLGRQRSPKNHQGPHMHPYLRAANATWDGADLSDVMEMNFKPSELEIYRLKKGDILLSEASGSANEVGKPFIWKEQIPDCCFQNTLIRVRLFHLPPYYLHLHFFTDALTGRFGRIAKGVGIHHLGANRLAEMPVAIPPLAEQERIVAEVERRLSVVSATERAITANLARAERLRQSILHRAFNGRLVPQESDAAQAQAITANSISTERQRITV